MIDNKNLILAIVLSVTILLGFEYYFKLTNPAPPPEALATTQHKAGNIPAPSQPSATPQPGAVPSAPGAPPLPGALSSLAPNPHENRAGVLAQGKRIPIETPRLHGSISLKGGLIDDLTMADYRETLDPESREIVLQIGRASCRERV